MIYYYYGDDSYRAKETVDALKKKFTDVHDPSGANIITLHQSDMTLESFFTAVKAQGFLSTKKFILIQNLFSHKELKDIQAPIIDFLKTLKNTTDENYIVFYQEGVPRKNSKLFTLLLSLCEPKHCSKQFDVQTGPTLIAWIQKQAARYGKKISGSTATYLIETVGSDSWNLHHEIHKVAHLAKASTIEANDIDMVTIGIQSDKIFPLLDAIGLKQKPEVFALFDESLNAGMEEKRLVPMLARQYRLITRAHELRRTTRNEFSIAQSLGLPPFITKKILRQSEHYTTRELERIYAGIMQLDELLKSNPERLKVALTDFISQL